MRKHILFAAAALLAAPLTASADGMNKGRAYDVPGTDVVYSHTIFTGGEVARDAREGYIGAVWARNRDLSKEGVLFRVMGTFGTYEYTYQCATCGAPSDFDGRAGQGDAMIGYQWVRDRFDMAVYVGIDVINHTISPFDEFNPVRGTEAGFKVALDLESHRHNGQQHYYALEGAYSTAFDTYFLLGRLGMNRNQHVFGVEGWLLGDETGNAQRLGAFLSRDLQLRNDLLAELTVSGGYQWVDNDGRDCGSFFGSEGAYATLNISFFFSGERHRHTPMK
jgi:hypothetical protein